MDFQKILDEGLLKLKDWAWDYGPKILTALIVFIVGRWIAKLVRRIVRKLMERGKVDKTLVGFASNMAYMALMAFVIISVLNSLGVDTSSFAALIAAAGLAVGFALQGSLSNFAAGVMAIGLRPYNVGDLVEAGGALGTIEEISIFSTILRTPDNKKVIVPNSKMLGDNIVNFSANGVIRIDLVFGIGYGDDVKKAKGIFEEILTSHPLVLQDPAPEVTVSELADSSVNFAVRPHVDPKDYWTVYFDVTEQVKLRLDAEGISIPFPQRDVHLFQEAS